MKSERSKKMEVRKAEGKPLREVMVKIGLERIDIQEGIIVEALLDSGATGLVISSEFVKKQDFKLKKLERPMNIRNVDGSLNKKEPIEHTVEVNIYYQGYRERTKVDSDFRDAVASMPQSRNRLENGGDENDKMPRGVW